MSDKNVAKAVTQHVVSQNDVTMYQDYDHASKHVQRHFYSKDNIDAQAAGGTKNIALENTPKLMQPALDYLHNVGDAISKGAKVTPEQRDQIKEKFVDYAVKSVGNAAFKEGSKEEREHFKVMAEGVIYAGEKGIKTHAVDSGAKEKTRAEGTVDFAPRIDGDKIVADRVAEIAKTGKTSVFFGAAHGNARDGTNGKDLDELLADKGLKVGKIGITEDAKLAIRSPGKEMPTTIIETNAKTFGIDWPGGNINVRQIEKKDGSKELGGELNFDKEDGKLKKVKEKDLGGLIPPQVSGGKAPEVQQSAGRSGR